MESSIVIKVKFGDTLRRFNAVIFGNEQLELDMEALRTKIVGLFNLATDADLTLTYTDVDGDVVTLVDDDDLCDVMRQRLNPIRINVLVNNNKAVGSRSYTRSSGNSTPMRSPRVQQQLQNVTTSVADVFNSVQEPLREAISKITLDAASQAASSAPQLAELVEIFSKIGQSYLFPGAQYQAGVEQNGAPPSNSNVPFTEERHSSKGGCMPEVVNNATFADQTSNSSQKADFGNDSKRVAAPVTPAPASVDLNLETPGDYISAGTATVNLAPAAGYKQNVHNRKEIGEGSNGHIGGMSGSGTAKGSADPMRRKCSRPFPRPFPRTACPFSGISMADNSVGPMAYPGSLPFKRFHKFGEGMGIFHTGVQCDGCGVHPISGPRFKSKVKENYDLCNICFSAMGNEADYIRMDHPMTSSYQDLRSKELYERMFRAPDPAASSCRDPRSKELYDRLIQYPPAPHLFKGGSKPGQKLDSRFIMDVNVMDGTMLAPSTPFSKIWRMRNSGNLVWPRGTQLVWIGGDKFSDAVSVEIEVPANGLLVEEELDIAVDFIAPEQPGRYISYWRMSSPSGQKFGQRVWVLIQVDASLNGSLCDSFHGLNLNLPPVSIGSKEPTIIDVNVEPMVDCGFPDPPNSNTIPEPVEPVVGEQPTKDQEENFPINDNLLVGGVSEPVSPVVSSSVSYPIIDLTAVPPVPVEASSPAVEVHVPASSVHANKKNDVEQILLKELEAMGFKQVDLNKEILRMNEYNLEQSVDDLCGVAEWDPILEELNEMGFYDRAKNKQLLVKNNGSIKRVVMDLIAGEE